MIHRALVPGHCLRFTFRLVSSSGLRSGVVNLLKGVRQPMFFRHILKF